MSLRIRSTWTKIVPFIMEVQPRPPTPPPPSPLPAEPPRKKRRRKAKQDGFVVPLEERNPGLFESCDWVMDGPYRRVPPYFYTYYTWAKERWFNVPIYEVFSSEFRDRQPEYYRAAVANGSVTVNGKTVDESYIVRNGDCISHKIHRHEPPVSSRPIKIIHHDKDTGLVVIDKPAGIPVHAGGRYHQNSIVSILRLEHGLKEILPCNRLDRLTSGVMFLGMSGATAAAMHDQLRERTVWKEYYCRVAGEFPEETITVDKAIQQVSRKHTLSRLVDNDGKPSTTVFERVFYDQKRNESVVLAKPLTGRTHQIRVHLQYLGHPIANDPIYANPLVFKSPGDVLGATDDEIVARLDDMGKVAASATLADQTVARPTSTESNLITPVHGLENPEMREMWSGEICDVCGTQLYLDPSFAELEIWLHAWKYSGRSAPEREGEEGEVWSYQSEVPEWGREDWQGPLHAPIEWREIHNSRGTGPGV